MFAGFAGSFDALLDTGLHRGAPLNQAALGALPGYREFVDRYAGASFGGGLYRIHDESSGRLGKGLLDLAFPAFSHVIPFAYDWLGRQFGIDSERVENGEPQVLMLDPGAGEALEIPVSFESFHNHELVYYTDAALATTFFEAWRNSAGSTSQLERSQCVGYRIPLFLGGADTLENLELTDFEVYWTLSAQLIASARIAG